MLKTQKNDSVRTVLELTEKWADGDGYGNRTTYKTGSGVCQEDIIRFFEEQEPRGLHDLIIKEDSFIL